MEDNQMIERLWERDETALSAVFEKYGRYCSTIARNIICNEQSVEEIVQDTLLKLWEAIPPNRPDNLQAFVGRITRNVALNTVKALDAQKRGGGETVLALDDMRNVSTGNIVENLAEQHEVLDAVNDFLRSLPSRKRKILVLKYWHCYRASDISQIVGMSEANVSNILRRQRKKLIEYLRKRGIDYG